MASGKKKSDFGVTDDSPCGTTFEHAGPGSRAGATNTKRKADFGVVKGSPSGDTFTMNRSHISIPNADRKPKESKVESSSASHGYKPARGGPQNFGGSVGVGKSSPK